MRRVIAFFVLVTAAVAPVPLASQTPVPASVVARVTALLAQRWHVAASMLVLEWGAGAGPAAPDTLSAPPLLVPEPGGRFSVVLPAAGAPGSWRWSLHAGVAESVYVARHALPRDAAIDSADVRDTVLVRWGVPPRETPARLGWITRRPIAAGEALTTPGVDRPPLIAAGDSVQFVYSNSAIAITLPGVALERAAASGDHLNVRLSAGRTLAGVAAGPHRVRALHP